MDNRLDSIGGFLNVESNGRMLPVWSGCGGSFCVAGMPSPTWWVTVDPTGEEDLCDGDAGFDILGECFEPYNQDGSVFVVEADIADVAAALWKSFENDDAADFKSGGEMNALWDLGEGRVAVGGFDNSGSDDAGARCADIVKQGGWKVVANFGSCHFDITVCGR